MADNDEVTTAPPAVNDAYTGMLAISLIALIVGCVLLYLDYSQYPDTKGPTVPKAPPIAGAAAPDSQPAPPPKVEQTPKDAVPKGDAVPKNGAPKNEAPPDAK